MKHYSLGVFFNIFGKDKKDWEKQVNFINSLDGVEHVEVLLEDTSLNNKQIRILKELLQNYRIIIHAPFMDLTLLSPHQEIVKTTISIFKKAIKIGKALNAETMT